MIGIIIAILIIIGGGALQCFLFDDVMKIEEPAFYFVFGVAIGIAMVLVVSFIK